jgi:asparagine synthase (glutamine-hydrolysing)
MRLDVDLDALARGEVALLPGVQHASAGHATLVLRGQPRDSASGRLLDADALLARQPDPGKCLAQGLHGSYAFAVLDGAAPAVHLYNDRMAMQRWACAVPGHSIRFAPRADTIADGAAPDAQALFSHLSNHVIASPATVFKGDGRLPPASQLAINVDGVRVTPYWTPIFQVPRQADFGAPSKEFRTVIEATVGPEAARLGGTVGGFLSGGTDSSTIAGLWGRLAGEPVRAYSVGFDADGYDEMGYARLAAKHFGLDHQEHYLIPEEVAGAMPVVAASYDQPFGNSSAVAAFHCARVAREQGCSALLAGDGGDELFGGNARYAKQSIFGWYEQVPGALRGALREPPLENAVAGRVPLVKKTTSYVQRARVPMPDPLHMCNLLRRLGLWQVLTPAFQAQVDPGHDLARQREVYAASVGAHLVNRMLAYDWRYTVADNDLPKVLGITQLAGIGTAFPLLDDDVLDFSLRLPHSYKLKGLKLRRFFKEALRGFLPDEIIVKKKQGFGLSFGVWALRHAQLAKLADDAMDSFAQRGAINPAFMRRLREQLLPAHPGYYGDWVWIIAMAEFWLRAHRPSWPLE